MKTLPMFVLVTLIPVAAASSANLGNSFGQDQMLPITLEKAMGNPELAKCRGAKCAGPGDTIRNGQDMDTAQQLAGNRGGQATSGTKKGSRHHDGSQVMPELADNRGGQATSGAKKGARHHDGSQVMPELADNRGGQATSGTKKGPRHHDDLIGSPA
jgi:hypothetical protein